MTMPLIVLVCNFCKKGIEGSLYSLFMGLMNLGYLVAAQMEALIVHLMGVTSDNFDNMPKCLFISIGFLCFVGAFTWFIKEENFTQKKDKNRKMSFEKNEDFIKRELNDDSLKI